MCAYGQFVVFVVNLLFNYLIYNKVFEFFGIPLFITNVSGPLGVFFNQASG